MIRLLTGHRSGRTFSHANFGKPSLLVFFGGGFAAGAQRVERAKELGSREARRCEEVGERLRCGAVEAEEHGELRGADDESRLLAARQVGRHHLRRR